MGRSNELEGLHTLPELLRQTAHKTPRAEALREFDRVQKVWKSLTYAELVERIEVWRRAYAATGLEKGDRVAILMPSGVEHVCADQGALANGLVPVPLHAIDTAGASSFVIRDSGAKVLVTNQTSRWKQIETAEALPELKTVILTDRDATIEPSNMREVTGIDAWLAQGEGVVPPEGPLEEDLAGIVYTSGTTGRPKGVMLTHRNVVSNVKATLECVSPRAGDVFLSFLPLSHTFERTAGYYLPLATGCTIVYNRSVLLLAEDLKTVRPDVIISVPRVYERIYARVRDKLAKGPALTRRLFELAVETGWRDFAARNGFDPHSKSSWFDPIIRRFVLPKVSETLLGQFGSKLRIAISGGAALNDKVARVFCGLGLPIIQGYGMTEASPILAGNCVEHNRPETVGRPFVNVELRLGEGGEIQAKAPSIMKGYWGRPQATAEAFTEDGWFRTGDVGEFLEDGSLKIIGRIKEIIVTSTGEKVPPADLESAIETDPLFAQAYVVGENRSYLALIAVVNPTQWEALATRAGVPPEKDESLQAPSVKTLALKRAKAAAAGFPNYALPRTVYLTKTPWTIEDGLLTPTLKLKRGPLSKKFASEIAALYASHG